MTNNRVTLRDVYALSKEMDEKLDKMGERISALEIWRANLMGKIAVVGAVIIFVVNFSIEYIKENILKR